MSQFTLLGNLLTQEGKVSDYVLNPFDLNLSSVPILHVDLMGVGSEQELTERFRWA